MTILTTNYLHYPTYSLGVISEGRLCGKKRDCSEGAFLRRATMELCMTMGLINREALATMVSVLSSLGTVHGILSNGIADEPIIFYSDRSKDDDHNLDTEVAPCALNSGQPSHNASNLKTPSIPSNLTAKRGDDHISKDQDDASDTPNPEVAAVSASIDADVDLAIDLSKLVHVGHEEWWDVEDNCFVKVDIRPLPLLEQDGLASTPARCQPYSLNYSLEESQNQINLHDDDGARWSASKEPAPHSLSTIYGDDGRGRRDENTSELGRDLLLTCQLSPSQINQ
jgi:hypothetical protein